MSTECSRPEGMIEGLCLFRSRRDFPWCNSRRPVDVRDTGSVRCGCVALTERSDPGHDEVGTMTRTVEGRDRKDDVGFRRS